ncbi:MULTISPECIES: sugar phosphate nucleotidyltransferase [Clostridium]|uniref:D-glycero-alpha-D-manno-heptose 1-phosphate guanylyltransferase n=3 Tax=Clostridium TaxID=1485 RepID=D8GMS4_CLOLD|nr:MULTISPECIES: NDP-sugar synthase [Clostridium]ADK15712.1 predicted glucose-1-phosphate nucleotidyltransferase with a transferase hexapeptide repeat [Clostridium ljungdahlii DSM 13528]AGY74964.1 NDP-sugar synthase [Clostridium autoethanogenum DSM 10061]ALU35137.1 Nucleotidyl transferase/ Mannose-1-phosphate guanylyltransferase [Clostridium autoethanogenum DSM 10061]OAA86598.1 D-glycero-alpha-D-manno-heptose 1-phosphate guanylyltransferase [Clostridium ljungdahlii DSM 13528]OVY49363.1 D-glyce
MKALLLAGGKGTRLRPLTDKLPKPMVPIMGKPLIERTILKLKESGVSEIVISTCYKSDYIENYLGDGKKYGLKIHYISEDLPLGTGGAIKNAESFFDDTFIIMNSDIVHNLCYSDFIKFHREKRASVSIAMTEVKDPSQYGVIEFDGDSYIKAFKEKPKAGETNSKWINAGVYIFDPEVLKEIPEKEIVSIEKDTYPLLLNKSYKMAAYKYTDYWIDIGTIKKYIKAHVDILYSNCNKLMKTKNLTNKSNIIFKNKSVKIHPSVKIIGPVFIGQDCIIEANSQIGPYVVLGNNCHIGSSCNVSKSVLWDRINVHENVNLTNSVVASDCTIEKYCNITNSAYVSNNYNNNLLAI